MAGVFEASKGDPLQGALKLDGTKSVLLVSDSKIVNLIRQNEEATLIGTLNDLSKVTLLQSISLGRSSNHGENQTIHHQRIFPHIVLIGDEHIDPSVGQIQKIYFVFDDALSLFYDYDTFGDVIDQEIAEDIMAQALEEHPRKARIPLGERPRIFYFTGNHQLIVAPTPLGNFMVEHVGQWRSPSPEGIYYKNSITASLSFDQPRTIKAALDSFYQIKSFFDLIAGRPQKIKHMYVSLAGFDVPKLLDVYLTHRPKRDKGSEHRQVHPGDTPINAVERPEEFKHVIDNWLQRSKAWQAARMRFSESFGKQRRYSVNRLITAANMFDVAPFLEGAEPVLSEDLVEAIRTAKRLFKSLAASPERDGVLGALGRAKKPSLKAKIRSHVKILSIQIKDQIEGIERLTEAAVDCRNYFVHGGDPKLDYRSNPDLLDMFTDALEFVFAASDLTQSGFDFKHWSEQPGTSHVLKRYLLVHKHFLDKLDSLAPVSCGSRTTTDTLLQKETSRP